MVEFRDIDLAVTFLSRHAGRIVGTFYGECIMWRWDVDSEIYLAKEGTVLGSYDVFWIDPATGTVDRDNLVVANVDLSTLKKLIEINLFHPLKSKELPF
jgi:hypothetical protein